MTHVRYFFVLLAALALSGSLVGMASADNSWNNSSGNPYHWARTANPFTLQLGDNVSSTWDSYLAQASADWSASSVLDTQIAPGKGGKNCKATLGRAEVCASKYGHNGWLGIAQIWVNSSSHITQGVVKMNDTYFAKGTYNTPAWRALVMCQEIGHIFGLDHQDENFGNGNLGTCMDYTSSPASNQHPNQHDYDMLEEIYAHLDSSTTIIAQSTSGGSGPGGGRNRGRGFDIGALGTIAIDLTLPDIQPLDVNITDEPSTWGQEIRRSASGNASVFAKSVGNGGTLLTHVFWAEPRSH